MRSLERTDGSRAAPRPQAMAAAAPSAPRRGTRSRRRATTRRAAAARALRRPRSRGRTPVARRRTRRPSRAGVGVSRSRTDRARGREARPRDQGGAGARRAAGALRGRAARNRAEPSAAKTLVNDLSRKLAAMDRPALDGRGVAEQGAPTREAQAEAQQAELERGVRADPLVQAVLERFPAPRSSMCAPEGRAPEPAQCRQTAAGRRGCLRRRPGSDNGNR